MFFDHASGIIGNLHKDGVAPSDAAKQLLFDDAQYDNAPTDPHHGGKIWKG
jgi:hypothetical protein